MLGTHPSETSYHGQNVWSIKCSACFLHFRTSSTCLLTKGRTSYRQTTQEQWRDQLLPLWRNSPSSTSGIRKRPLSDYISRKMLTGALLTISVPTGSPLKMWTVRWFPGTLHLRGCGPTPENQSDSPSSRNWATLMSATKPVWPSLISSTHQSFIRKGAFLHMFFTSVPFDTGLKPMNSLVINFSSVLNWLFLTVNIRCSGNCCCVMNLLTRNTSLWARPNIP